MRKVWKRFLAYTVDMMVVLLITQSLSGIPAINKQLTTYTKYYNQYVELTQNYTGLKTTLNNNFKDKKLSEKEYASLVEKYPTYQTKLDEYYQDKLLTEKEYDKLIKQLDKDYMTKYQELYYKIDKNSSVYMSIYILVIVLYFVLFNRITDGQTLGKKLVRLKIVNNKEETKKVPVWSYLVRACLLYQPVYYLLRLILIYLLNQGNYYTVTSMIYDIQYYVEIIIIAMIFIRVDGRGLHDLLAQTRVISYNRDGIEIEAESTLGKMKKLKSKD